MPDTAPLLRRRAMPTLVAALFCLLFCLEGIVFIPYLGLQNDEALFSEIVYPPYSNLYSIRIFGHVRFPTMMMSYLGTLKAGLFEGIFALVGPSIWSVRIPVLLAGAATVWLFFVLMRRIAGARAAIASTALLAADAAFVMTTTMDWGPVALQHLLLVSGLLLLLRFHDSGRLWFLAGGFFLFGLALWDKALFSWSLAGLVAGAVVVFPRPLFQRLTRRNLAVAVVSLLVGAAPLVSFNIKHRMETFRGNAHFSSEDLSQKETELWRTLDGSSLFGYMVRDEPPLEAARPTTRMEALSIRVSEAFGRRRPGLLPFAMLLALALLPWLWKTPARKPMLFALVFMAVVWLQMAFTQNAGSGAHHVVLLWPFPQLFAGVGLAAASRKLGRAGLPALAAVLIAICGSGVVVLNQYLAQLVQDGPTVVWTDAINPLSTYLRRTSARHVWVVDWGILNSLRILNAGKLPLDLTPQEIPGDAQSQAAAVRAMGVDDAVFLAHTPGNEMFLGVNAALDRAARAAGLRHEVLAIINDGHHRPVFQVYRYVEAAP